MKPDLILPLKRADSRTFTGEAYSALVASAQSELPVKVYFVRFARGARTFWHTHSGAQIIIVVSGVCRYQLEGEEVRTAAAGQSVRFEAGVKHWHGAADDGDMEHYAINLDAARTEWHEEAHP